MTVDQALEPEELLARADRAVLRGLDNLGRLQTERGSWCGDYGGPMFLLPLYVGLQYTVGRVIPADRRERMIAYFFNVQNDDGSVGLHAWGDGCMFTTSLSYSALRLLGAAEDDPRMKRMRGWIRANGTPLGAASWGKFALALLNLYDFRGLHPIPPELWLLPYAAPIHPGRLWCHCRQVYLPMAWLYGRRAACTPDALIHAIRAELYGVPYESIRFEEHRNTVAPSDNYRPLAPLMRAANRVLSGYEQLRPTALRELTLERLYEHICYEDRATADIDIGPVNAILNTLCHHFQRPGGGDLRRGLATLDGYLWDGHDGMKMQGYNSTELWDTAFAVQTFLATPYAHDHGEVLRRAHGYIRDNQILDDVPDRARYYRHRSRGGWPFSNRAHGWPITDCTAEGLKCALALEKRLPEPIRGELLRDAVRLILSWQNDDGGWATYERKRGGDWLEHLNPSQVFDRIMVDYSYVECTSACLQALAQAKERFSGEFDDTIDRATQRGVQFLRKEQRPDGSFEGSWGVCFTYGTWFGVSGLVAAGVSTNDEAIQRACAFLLAHQRPDGGWGEHFTSCSSRRYVDHPESQVVMTSWALLALLRGRSKERGAMRRAVRFLTEAQAPDGAWLREAVAGVFNRTCMINYDNYRHYFPVWAMGEWLTAERASEAEGASAS
jgi:squalene/oxidosqualene cyclase-like protein